MPAVPGWFARIPEILAAVESAPPILDRPSFERLFQVSRRQAIRLMAMMGGYQIGKTFLVERASLIGFLEQLRQSPECRRAHQRKSRILNLLREQVVISAVPPTAPAVPGAGISVGPGQVTIHHEGAADLLAKLAALAATAAEDYPRFREMVES